MLIATASVAMVIWNVSPVLVLKGSRTVQCCSHSGNLVTRTACSTDVNNHKTVLS